MNLDSQIDDVANRIRSAKKFTEASIDEAVSVLKSALITKETALLNKEDIDDITDALTLNAGHQSYYSWMQKECFNRILLSLRTGKVLESPYIINNAIKMPRDLIVHFDRQIPADVARIKVIWEFLFNFMDCDETLLIDEEIDMICAFIASCIIFGEIQFAYAHRAILSLEFSDISLSTSGLMLPFEGSKVSSRYFLPAHAALRLNLWILFKFGKAGKARPDGNLLTASSRLFPILFNVDDFPTIFKQWTSSILRLMRYPGEQDMGITEFYKASHFFSAIDGFSPTNHIIAVPPFVHSVQIRDIKSYSYPDLFLFPLLGGDSNVTYTPPYTIPHTTYVIKSDTLRPIIWKITTIRRGADNKDLSSKERLERIDSIKSVVEESQSIMPDYEYSNCLYFALWIIGRCRSGSKLKTINNYASIVASFLDILSKHRKFISKLTEQELLEIFAETKQSYNSPAIRSRVKGFMEFVQSETRTQYSKGLWSRKPVKIKEILTEKPLISCPLIKRASEHTLRFLAQRLVPSGIELRIKYKMRSSSLRHKANNLSHAFRFDYYTGLRREELLSLKGGNLYLDEGPMLIIFKGKTKNAARCLPLWLLLPDDYLSEFMNFVKDRPKPIGNDDYIFSDEHGKKWDSNEFVEDIQDLFAVLGIKGFKLQFFRHSFASWLLLRIFKALHRELIPQESPFLSYPLFGDRYDDCIKELLYGKYYNRDNPPDFDHMLFAVAKLMGHAGPIVTLERYVHTVDWIYYFIMKNSDCKTALLTSKKGTQLLQVSFPSLPSELRGRGEKTVNLAWLLKTQIDVIQRRFKNIF